MRRPLPTEPLLDVEKARARVLGSVGVMDSVELLLEAAAGMVVASDVVAPHPMPRFDNSAMDGYALRSEDAARSRSKLVLVGEVRAGDNSGSEVVRPGTIVKIMTGAPLPPGADAVIEVEETSEENGEVDLRCKVEAGRNVRPAGDDFVTGALLIERGVEIGPGEAALLASIGATPVAVHRRPRVAVLVTGDELVDPGSEPAPGQIRDSNSTALRVLVETAGGEVATLERVPDTLEAHIDAFDRAARVADMIVSSGGVAVGDFDFVKDAVELLGAIDLWRVAMQPGKPVVLGNVHGVPFLGLPGNPVSVHVSFEQFVRPALRKMRGCRSVLRPTVEATLTHDLQKRPGRLHFVRVRLSRRGSGWQATPTGAQGSHVQSSLVDCDGVARFVKTASKLSAGDRVVVEVWRLPSNE